VRCRVLPLMPLLEKRHVTPIDALNSREAGDFVRPENLYATCLSSRFSELCQQAFSRRTISCTARCHFPAMLHFASAGRVNARHFRLTCEEQDRRVSKDTPPRSKLPEGSSRFKWIRTHSFGPSATIVARRSQPTGVLNAILRQCPICWDWGTTYKLWTSAVCLAP
jgi:hypothetical protein